METCRKLNHSPRVKRYVLLLAAAWTLCAALGFAGEARVQDAPLVIGVGLDYAPYEFLDEYGEAAGYNVDLTEAIAEVMELDVEVKIGPWGDIRRALEAGEIDAVAGMPYSVERDKLLDFAPPHTVIHHAIFVRRDAPTIETEEDLRGKEIIVTRGDIMHDYVLEKGLSDNPVLMDTLADTLRLLASGKHDCALVAKLPGLYCSKELGLSNIEIVGPLLGPSDHSYAVIEGNAALLAQLSEGLAIVGEMGRYKEIYDKWLGVLEPRGVPLNTILKYIALAPAPILLLLAAVWSLSLKRQVARRTAELRDEITEHMRTEEKLRESEDWFRSLVETTSDWIWEVDKDGVYTYSSPKVTEILGYGPKEIIGKTPFDFMAPEEAKRIAGVFQSIVESREPFENLENTNVAKDGRLVVLETSGVPVFDASGHFLGYRGIDRDVTERKRAEDALRFTQFSVDRIAESAVWVGPDARFVSVNEHMCRSAGYSRDELLSMSVHDVDPDMSKEVWPDFWRELKESGSVTFESQMRTKNGQTFPVEITANYIEFKGKEYICAFARDVTERKLAEETLREENSFRNAIIKGAAEGLCVCHKIPEYPFVKFTVWNDRMTEITGYTMEEINRVGWYQTMYPEPEVQQRAVERMARMREGDDLVAEEWVVTRADGEKKVLFISTSVLETRDGEVHVLAMMHDVTERKRAEDERRKLEEQVQRTQRIESLGVLAGGVAHDFNNLLTSILGNADMALETLPEASPAWRRIAQIEKASMNAADLCSQMLAYAGKGRFIVEPTDLNAVVKEMSHLLRSSISKDVILDLVFEDDLPAVEADAIQMQQVVMNLVSNASEAIDEDSGVVTVATGVMDCDRAYLSRSYSHDNQPKGRYVYIDVADMGCGMDEQAQAKMFEPFFTTKFTGRGLGLAAVLGIIRGHGGAIVVDSQSGRGTTVRVLFPALDHYEPIQTEPQQRQQEPVYTFSGTVLVVDDEDAVRDIGKFMLETAGFDVLTAENGYEAIEMYRKNADVIVCVVLDLTMPHMDGIKVFEQLRSIRDDVCVVLTSGYSEEEISKRYAGTGIAGFIHKPYLFSTLKTKLHEALRKQSAT